MCFLAAKGFEVIFIVRRGHMSKDNSSCWSICPFVHPFFFGILLDYACCCFNGDLAVDLFFASLSALSFPGIPACPGIHGIINLTGKVVRSLSTQSSVFWTMLSLDLLSIAWRADMESVKITILFLQSKLSERQKKEEKMKQRSRMG